ncbi:hypothetical protein [Candidatus Ichthyocystis hellenicum]|uniref:hypothetical protein n=1 Tax=Candidatus Ichthyocystis hellenicum TaxID=1561003 RepID=UPI000B845FFA|nr:hypothetical protein [Candidatus Ichthyocystis hellenicum]
MNSICGKMNKYLIDQDTCGSCCDSGEFSRDKHGGDLLSHAVKDSDLLCISPSVRDVSSSVSSVDVDLNSNLLKGISNRFVVGTWGFNIHPDDDKLFLHIRRKFSIKIKDHLSIMFSNMLKDRYVLSSGKILTDCSWFLVSHELIAIAIKSIVIIMEEQYEELDRVLPKVRIVGIGGDDSCHAIRKVTDYEIDIIRERAKNFICRRLNYIVRIAWMAVTKAKARTKNRVSSGCFYSEIYKNVDNENADSILKFKLRHSDNLSILNARKKFSLSIKSSIYHKFSTMIKNKHKFDNGIVIGKVSWMRLSKELFPIAQDEVKHIIDDEIKELEAIVSRARVMVDQVDREITSEEKSVVLENIITLIHNSLKYSCRIVWKNVLSSSKFDFSDSCNTGCVADISSSIGIDKGAEEVGLKINLYHEDDLAIFNIKRMVSREIGERVGNRFSEIVKDKHKYGVGKHRWLNVSKDLLPVAKEEIDPVMERSCMEIKSILLKSRAIFFKPDGVSIVRELTSEEGAAILTTTMKSMYERVICRLGNIWNRIIKSSGEKSPGLSKITTPDAAGVSGTFESCEENRPSTGVIGLAEIYKAELDNIRLEFVGSLSMLIDEVFSSLSLGVGNLSSGLGNVMLSIRKRGYNLFREGGFFDRVELLLSDARVVDLSGGDRLITDKENKIIFQKFMDNILSDRDYLIRKRTEKLNYSLSLRTENGISHNIDSGMKVRSDRRKTSRKPVGSGRCSGDYYHYKSSV